MYQCTTGGVGEQTSSCCRRRCGSSVQPIFDSVRETNRPGANGKRGCGREELGQARCSYAQNKSWNLRDVLSSEASLVLAYRLGQTLLESEVFVAPVDRRILRSKAVVKALFRGVGSN